MHRRTFLATAFGAAVLGTAGCLGGPPGQLAPASDEPISADGSWNQRGGGPGHARVADGTGPGDAVESRWRYTGESDDYLRPRAVVDETVFATDEEMLVAIDAARGEEQWRASVPIGESDDVAIDSENVYLPGGWFERGADDVSLSPYPEASGDVADLTLLEDRLYYATGASVIAWEPTVDEALWSVDLADELEHGIDGLFATDGTVAAAGDSTLVGLALTDGSWRWRYDRMSAEPYYLNVAGRAGTMYVSPVPDGPVRAIDADTGTERWRYDNGFPAYVSVTDEHVVLGGTPEQGLKHRVEVLDASGDQQWATPEERNDSNYDPPVVGDGTVYASHVAGVFAYDVSNGDELWSLPAGGGDLYPIGDLIPAGSGLFLYQDGDVYGLAPG